MNSDFDIYKAANAACDASIKEAECIIKEAERIRNKARRAFFFSTPEGWGMGTITTSAPHTITMSAPAGLSLDLMNADLKDAILMNADLSGACLMNADFSGANLQNAKFDGANLHGTIFAEASRRHSA